MKQPVGGITNELGRILYVGMVAVLHGSLGSQLYVLDHYLPPAWRHLGFIVMFSRHLSGLQQGASQADGVRSIACARVPRS